MRNIIRVSPRAESVWDIAEEEEEGRASEDETRASNRTDDNRRRVRVYRKAITDGPDALL